MKSMSIWKNKIFILTILIGFLEPNCIAGLSAFGGYWKLVHLFFLFLRCCSISLAFVVFFISFHSDKFFNGLIMIGSYLVFVDFFIANTEPIRTIFYFLTVISFAIIVKYYKQINCMSTLLDVLKLVFGCYVVINFVLIIFKPNGLYTTLIYTRLGNGGIGHFLGFKNTHIYFYIPYLTLLVLTDLYDRKKCNFVKKIWIFVIYTIMLLSCIFVKASTATLILLLVGVFFVFNKRIKGIHNNLILIISILISALLIGSNYLTNVTKFIAAFFGKTASLSGRVDVWKNGIQTFLRNPIFGQGLSSVPDNINYLQYHNKYLDNMCVGGIIYFVLFLVVLYSLCKFFDNCEKAPNNAFKLLVISYSILFIVEGARFDYWFWCIIAICFYSLNNYNNLKHKYLFCIK